MVDKGETPKGDTYYRHYSDVLVLPYKVAPGELDWLRKSRLPSCRPTQPIRFKHTRRPHGPSTIR